ncbi:MAG: ribosomal protein S18-alanine N-acetyltransferase [Vicinamibacterales bacterium]
MSATAEPVTFERLSLPDAPDLQSIAALESSSFSNPWTPQALLDMIASEVTRLYVARHDRQIIAFCACWVIAGELHINTLAVDQDMRRRRIATKLVQYVLEESGASRATLEVRRSNIAALKLYEGLGFTATAVRRRYYSNPDEDALILWVNP